MRKALAVLGFLAVLLSSGATLASLPSLVLQVDLDPGTRNFQAVALVTPTARIFRFALHASLEIKAASAGKKPLQVTAMGRDGSVRLWQVMLPAGTDQLRLEYGGTLPPLDSSLDHREVLRSLPPMASSQGSFLPAGAAWYPQPSPLFAYRVSLSLPADQRALVPGRLRSEDVPESGAGRYRANFEFPHPTDGIDLMAGPWVVREKLVAREGGGSLRLRTYFPPDLDAMAGLADGYLEDTQRYLVRYEDEIGAYPFSEFSVVASPLPTGFGMPTLTYLGADVLKLPFIRATSLGHEVLHNWWGNGVYVDYATGNWSEGLTTFMADYAYKEKESIEAARQMRLGWLRDFAAVPAGGHQSLSSFRSRAHGAAAAVGYGKAAMVFVMLRDAIGADAFRRGIRAFWLKHRFKVAAWKDLQGAFEVASGRPLEAFFRQWLDRPGGPTVNITKASIRSGTGSTRLRVDLEQAAPAYALRLPVQVLYPDRSENYWIHVEGQSDSATLNVDSRPHGLRLDPGLRVWRRLEREQLPPILRQWIVAPSPRLVLASGASDVNEAALALAKRLFESPANALSPENLGQGGGPVLLVGLHADVDAALARNGLMPRPSNLTGRGSAQVWTIDQDANSPVAVISAVDAAALRALLRPLPHYGSQSWLIFDGGRAVERGIWPAAGRLIPVRDDG